jgi:DNA gyrase subunit A
MGVIFAKPDKNDRIIEVARNSERGLEDEESAEDDVTLAEESPAFESEDASGDAEPNDDNTEVTE